MTLLVLIGSIWKLWTRHCGIHTDQLFTPLERSSQTFFTLAVEWSLDMYRMGYYIVCVKIPYWTSNIVDIMLIEG